MKLINKPFTEINIGDVRISQDSFGSRLISFEFFDDYDGKEIVSNGINLYPGHAIKGGCQYGGTGKRFEDKIFEMKNFLSPKDARTARIAYKRYKEDCKHLFGVYIRGIQKKEVTPLYYIDDEHLNVELHEGDVLMKVDKYSGNLSLLELKNCPKYHHSIENSLKQEDMFYDWLTETGEDYDVRFYGNHFVIGEKDLMCIQNTSETFDISAKEGELSLVKGITLDWISDRIINITKKFYDALTPFCNFELEPMIINHYNGKKYSEWEVPENLIDAVGEEINRKEYICG